MLVGSGAAAEKLASILVQLNYAVDAQPHVEAAMQIWTRGECEAVLLAMSSAECWSPFIQSHLSAVRAFRQQRPRAPIIVLSGSRLPTDRIAALDAGADQYLTEHCDIRELAAHLSAILKTRVVGSPAQIHAGPLIMTAGDPRVLIGSGRVELTPYERILLELLARSTGSVVAKERIAQGFAERGRIVSTAAVQLLVCRLRRRLQPFALSIETIRGFGYCLSILDRQPQHPSWPIPSAISQGQLNDPDVPLAEASSEIEPQWWNTRLLEYTNDAIIVWEMQGRGILYWNRAAEQLYEYPRSLAHGRTTHELLRTELPCGVTQLESTLAKYGVWIGELTHTTRSGRRVQVEGRLTLMSQSNERWLVLEVNRDITDRKAAEESRRAMQLQLEDLRRLQIGD